MVAWWNTSWKKRKKITVPGSAEPLTNFPVRVHLINKGYELSKTGMRFGIGSANDNMVEVNWWKFENNANDDGQNDDDISLVDGASYSGTSAVGSYSLALDGTADCATAAASGDLKGDVVGGISCWMRVTTTASDQTIFSLGDTNADTVARLYFDASAGDVVFESRITGTSKTVSSSNYTFDINTWYHIVVVVDSSNVGRIFVNNNYVGYSSDARWFSYAGAGLDNARIGCDNYNSGGNTNFLNGFIDDLRIFDKTITYPDVTTLYNSGSGTLITLPRIDFSDFKAAGADVRFTDSGGAELDFEIEIWGAPDPIVTTGTATAGTSTSQLTDSGGDFVNNGVKIGMIVYNITRDCMSLVVDVTDGTNLAISYPTGTVAGNEDWQDTDEYEIIPQVVMWVKVPSISSETDIYMYYSNAAASDGQSVAATWSQNFVYVAHARPGLNAGGSAWLADSTNFGYPLGASGGATPGTMTNGSCAWYLPGSDDWIDVSDHVDDFMNDNDNQSWGVEIHVNLLGADFSQNYNLLSFGHTTDQYMEVTNVQRTQYDNRDVSVTVTGDSWTVQADTEYKFNFRWDAPGGDLVKVGNNDSWDKTGAQGMNPTDWSAGGSDNYMGNDPDNAGRDGIGHYSEFRVYNVPISDGWIRANNFTLKDEMWLKYGGEEPTLYIDSISDNGPKYAGEAITFTANYSYIFGPIDMQVCKSDSCAGGTCDGGTWASTDGDVATPVTAAHTTVSDDHGSNDYYIFLFDDDDSSVAAINNSQSGAFTVTAPEIDAISDDSPVYGGNDVTFTIDWTWANGNVDVRVCKTSGLTAGVCDGGEWASDTNVAGSTTDLTYTTIASDIGSNDYYVYVMDTTDTSITAHNAPQSSSFTVSGPEVTSVTDTPDPSLVGDQVTFIVDWLWPIGNVDIYICKTDSCTGAGGCTGGANQTWVSGTNISLDPKTFKYSTTSPGTKDYYVYVYDTNNTDLGTTSGTHGTFDVNLDNIYFHFEPFRRRYGLTSYTSRWDCNEATGSTLNDRNTTTDNNLTISDATWSSSGRFYYCLSFDGTDDFAYSTDVSDYSTDTIGAVSLWFNTTDLTSDRVLFSICDWSSSDKTYVELRHESTGEVSATLKVDGTTYWSIITSDEYVVDDWYSVILVQTGAGPLLYIDGSLATTIFTDTTFKNAWMNDLITNAGTYTADRLIVGGLGDSSAVIDDYYGLIEDVRVYSELVSAINAEDICSMASFTTGVNCSITDRSKDENQIYNKIQVLGNSGISSDIIEDSDSQTDYGIRELTYTDRSIEDSTDANEVANRILERYKDPIERIKIAVQSRDMREVVGDITELTDTNTGLDGDVYRIVSIERKYGSGGDVLVYEIETV